MANRIAGLLFAVPILLTPWLLGGVKESTHLFVTVVVSVAFGVWLIGQLLSHPRRTLTRPVPTAVWPILLGIAWALTQLVPMPKPIATLLAPHTVALRDDLSAGSTLNSASMGAPDTSLGFVPYRLSLRPAETRYQLALLVLAFGCFWLAMHLFYTERAIVFSLTLVAANGGLLALVGMLQALAGNGRLLWIGRPLSVGAPFATFINRNNAAGFLNICLAAALTMAVWRIRGSSRNRSQVKRSHSRPNSGQTRDGQARLGPRPNAEGRGTGARSSSSSSPGGSDRRSRRSLHLAGVDPTGIAMLAIAALIMAGIVTSLSRGGTLAAATGLLVAVPIAAIKRRNAQPLWLGGILVVGVLLIGWVGRWEMVSKRMQTLGDGEKIVSDGRLPNWTDALHSVPDYWRTGSGLGTYSDIYSVYQHRYDPGWYKYAENQFVQGLVEGGVPALLLLLIEIALVARCSWRLTRRERRVDFALGVGGIACLAGQLVSGSFDFGLYHPAQMMLLASFCGIVVGRATLSSRLKFESDASRNPIEGSSQGGKSATDIASFERPTMVQAVIVLVPILTLAVGLPCALARMHTLSIIAPVMDRTVFDDKPGGTTEPEIQTLIGELQAASLRGPDDYWLQFRLAMSYEQLYQVRMLERFRKNSNQSLEQLWRLSSVIELHRRVHQRVRSDRAAAIDNLKASDIVRQTLFHSWDYLLQARRACPIRPEVHLSLARLAWIAGPATDDAIHLQRTERLAPASAPALIGAGQLDMQAGRMEDMSRRWLNAIKLTDRSVEPVLELANRGDVPMDTVVQAVLPANAELLLRLATREKSSEPAWRHALLERAASVLQSDLAAPQVVPTDPQQRYEFDERVAGRHFLLGQVYQLQGDLASARRHLRMAIDLRSRKIEWRFALGMMLLESGQASDLEEARTHLSWCARRDPNDSRYRNALKRIHGIGQ